MSNTHHQRFMQQALELARRGEALTSPNPCVGAILVGADGEVIGEGSHTYEGKKHAEVLAIEEAVAAGSATRGATLFVNLEPCSHHGRTPPCVESVLDAGISRVVAAMLDPNPEVSGRGFDKLRGAGVEVIEGVLGEEAQKLNEAFAKYIRRHTPLVTMKSAMTLDGKIAPPPQSVNNPHHGVTGGWITSDAARAHVQQMRHASDAIMVGVGTVTADDPLLTDRTGLPRRRPLLRVILDSRLRLPLESRVVQTAHEDVLVLCSFAEEKKRRALEAHSVRVEQVQLAGAAETAAFGIAGGASGKIHTMPAPRRRTGTGKPIKRTSEGSDGRPDLRQALQRLGEMEITSLMIEGGALVNWTALASGVVDKVFLYYAPKILAGTGAVPFAAGTGFQKMSEAAHIKRVAIHHFGEDFAVEGYIRDPYSD